MVNRIMGNSKSSVLIEYIEKLIIVIALYALEWMKERDCQMIWLLGEK